jgi:hypothetical protein
VPVERMVILEFHAAKALAAPLALRRAAHSHRWPTRRSIHVRSRLLRRGAIPTDHLAEARSAGCHKHIWPTASSRYTCAPQDRALLHTVANG